MNRKIRLVVVAALLVLVLGVAYSVAAGFAADIWAYLFSGNSIHNIIDFYVDKDGDFYYLDYTEKYTYLYKVKASGTIIFKESLPRTKEDLLFNYKKLVVDNNDNIYILTTTRDAKQNKVIKEAVAKFDPKGEYVKDLFALTLEENTKQENPFININNRLINMQLINDNLYILDQKDPLQIDLLEISLKGNIKPYVKKSIAFRQPVKLTDILYAVQDEFYFANRQAEIYRIYNDGVTEKIDTFYDGYTKVIPNTISVDGSGNLYFTDILNGKFVKYNRFLGRSQAILDYSFIVNENKKITFKDLRNIKITANNEIIGQSKIGLDSHKYLAFINLNTNGGKVIDNIRLPIYLMFIKYLIWGLLLFILIRAVLLLRERFAQRISLTAKQMFILVPTFLLLMAGLIVFLTQMTIKFTTNVAYDRIESLAQVTAGFLDGDKFKDLDHPAGDFGPDYLYIANQVDLGVDDIYYVTYLVEDDQIYVGVSNSIQSYTPIDYLYDPETVEVYKKCVLTGQNQTGTTMDSYGQWMFALAPIRDNLGNIVGILEIGMDNQLVKTGIEAASQNLVLLVLAITLIVVLAYTLMLKYSLKSLNILKTGVSEIAAGKWDTRVEVKTRDEFSDIGYAFNRMSDYIQDYVQELIRLNNAYIKFVPEELFTLLNKKSVLEVNLGDQSLKKMSLMYINTRDFYDKSRCYSTQEIFDYLNSVFQTSAEVIGQNSGVIERFEGSGVIALFGEKTDDALNSALKLLEKFQENREIGISIHHGEIMLGIVGHHERLAATAISEEVNKTLLLEKLSAQFGTRLILSDRAFRSLTDKEKYFYRYIGKVLEKTTGKVTELYEFLDSIDLEDKNRKIKTKELFEKGVSYYQEGQFFEARKRFIDVIKIDGQDKLAKTYLFLCEKYHEQVPGEWQGVLEYL